MSAKMLNRAKMTTATTGTGTVTLGAASTGCATFAEAGAVNATAYTYTIEDGDDFEVGRGTYTSAGTTFSRDTVLLSKISGTAGTSKINLSGSATIFVTAAAQDFREAAITSGTIDGITDLALADGGTGASLADPGADRIMFWDDSGGTVTWLAPDTTIEVSTTTLQRAALTGAITASAGSNTTTATGALVIEIDGGGSTITTGIKGDLTVPFAGTITQATLLADQSGSIVVDIWKDTYANYPPTDADSITAAAPPTISSATKSQDSTLTGWTTSISAGDTLRFNVDSITTCTRVTLVLKITKTG
jgi:hypothetical protein